MMADPMNRKTSFIGNQDEYDTSISMKIPTTETKISMIVDFVSNSKKPDVDF